MSIFVRNSFQPGKFNNYLIAGNICNAFVIGELGSQDDFFLVGAEPQEESVYPFLTGNVLDSEGNVLFRLIRNVLILNPGNCSKIMGDQLGYEIHDSAGKLIFRVRTAFDCIPGYAEKTFVTTITANCYDKRGNMVFKANSGEADERMEASVKSAFGFSGGLGLVQGMSKDEMAFACAVLSTRGAVHQLIMGEVVGQELDLDGKALMNVRLRKCKLHVRKGEFVRLGRCVFEECEFYLEDAAANIANLVQNIPGRQKPS
jgi:hypothetical protein